MRFLWNRKRQDSHQESARKPSGPRIIRTARFQIIDKTNAGQPDEVSNIEHIEPQESNTSVPSDSNMETDVAEQKSEIPEVKDNKASSADQNTKIVNLQDIKAKKQQPPIDLNHMEQVPEYVPKKKKNIFRKSICSLISKMKRKSFRKKHKKNSRNWRTLHQKKMHVPLRVNYAKIFVPCSYVP